MKLRRLNDMMVFVKVIDNGSFTAAGDELNMAKSQVSKYISRLEADLGTQLLHRSTRSLSPTESGRALYETFANVCDTLEEAERVMDHTGHSARGILHVASPISFGHLHLAPAIAEFMRAYPEIKVEMLLGNHYDDIVTQGADEAIQLGKLPDSDLKARRIAMRGMRVCASPSYLKKHGTPNTPGELVEHNCLNYANSSFDSEWQFLQGGKRLQVPIAGNLKANSSQALEAAAVAGLGIVMLPGYMMTRDMKQGRLVSILQEYCPQDIGIHAVYPRTRYVAPKVRVFIDFLVEQFGEETYWGD